MNGNNIRRHLNQIASNCGFVLDTKKSDKNSKYYECRHKGQLQMSVLRISNHCTNAATWQAHYGTNKPQFQLSKKEIRRYKGNYNGLSNNYYYKRFYSIVIFDPKIDGEQNCGDVTGKGISVSQRAYNAIQLREEQLVEIENYIKSIATGGIKENKQYNTMNNTKKRVRLTESHLRKILTESVIKILIENHIINNLCLQVEPKRYGEFWIRDVNTWLTFHADAWIDRGMMELNVESDCDDKRAMQLCDSPEFQELCKSAILSDEPQNIEGFQEYVDGSDSWNQAIEELENTIKYQADTLRKRNKREHEAIMASDPDAFSAIHGW